MDQDNTSFVESVAEQGNQAVDDSGDSERGIPGYEKASFNCPHCGAFAEMRWNEVVSSSAGKDVQEAMRGATTITRSAECAACESCSVWVTEQRFVDTALGLRNFQMVWPPRALGPPPHRDLPPELRDDFEEARRTASVSPRGSAALSRLVVQKLLVHLGGKGKNINSDIGALVSAAELRPRIVKALDVVRIVGTNAVHPGELDVKDDVDLAVKLLKIINVIVDDAIAIDREMDDIFNQMPQSSQEAIARRDRRDA